MSKSNQKRPDMFQDVELKRQKPERRINLDRSISDLVGSLCDPIIVHGGPWGTRDMIPEWLRNRITIDRMLELMVAHKEKREPTGTNSEALAYLIPASMEAPMGHDWSQIYLYLATVVMDNEKDKIVPKDIRVDRLNDYQLQHLNRLKRWIYNQRSKVRLERDRAARRESKEAAAAEKRNVKPKFEL